MIRKMSSNVIFAWSMQFDLRKDENFEEVRSRELAKMFFTY